MKNNSQPIPCEKCGAPTHMDDILTPDGLIPHLICNCCGYTWVPEFVYEEDMLMFDYLYQLPINEPLRKRG